jgi:hypothetical protein
MVDVHTVADRLGTLGLPDDRVKTLRERLLRVAPRRVALDERVRTRSPLKACRAEQLTDESNQPRGLPLP